MTTAKQPRWAAMTPLERFYYQMDKDGPLPAPDTIAGQRGLGPCHLWTGAPKKDGYGQMKFRGRQMGVARVAWILLRGEIPEGHTIDHLCRVHLCVNPDHLEPVTMRVNTLRGTSWAAVQAAQTTCGKGHPLTGANLRPRADGYRDCRECANERKREYRRRDRSRKVTTARRRRARMEA